MRTSIAVILCVIITGFQSILAGSHATENNADSRWGFSAELFNQDATELSVSKKVSRTTMLLFSIGLGWSDVEEEHGLESYRTVNEFLITAGPEIRRLYYRHPSIALYAGIQPAAGYSRIRKEIVQTSAEDTRKTLSLGVNFTLGVEYEIINNLSLSVHFLPLRYSYNEVTNEAGQNSPDITTKVHHIQFAQQTGLYVRIYF